jgi:ABC-type uncharacterized transport system ATPase component
MANPIGSINVTLGNQSSTQVQTANPIGSINVTLGNQSSPQVQTVSYGQKQALKNATDLSLAGAQDGDVIVYDANTNSFVVEPTPAASITNLDAGTF